MNINLVEQIATDLNINMFKNENELSFGNRVLFSALVAWARVQVFGKSFADISNVNEKIGDFHNVDIMHIQTRLSQVAYGLLETLPYEERWIKNSDVESVSNNLASLITEQLLFCYELSEFNSRRITISPQNNVNIGSNSLLLGFAICQKQKLHSIGLGRWIHNQQPIENYREVFCIPNVTKEEYLNSLINNAAWQKSELNGLYHIFKLGTVGWYSKAWMDLDKKNIPLGLSLLKNIEIGGGYFLLKKEGNKILIAKLDGYWYLEKKEIYRIKYLLNHINKSPAEFKAKHNLDHILLHCNSSLPHAEMRLLLMSSWPFETYDDKYRRIIPISLWNDLLKIFNNLGISIDYVSSI